MRLGAYDCELKEGSLGLKLYGKNLISERHRHRLEVNNQYVEGLEAKGLVISGRNTKLNLVELIELNDHPFFIACQYHPEFKSKPTSAHPLFLGFLKASAENVRTK
jgi:CTP synthase